MNTRIFVLAWLFTLSSLSCSTKNVDQPANNDDKAKNIILMIADGMGVSHLYAAMIANQEPLNIELMNDIGFVKTHAADAFNPDSGAAATAIATGQNTYNGAIGVNSDTVPVTSILKYARQNERATGIVVTCAVTHATPAAFYANQKSREMHEEIATDLISGDVDIFIGGGLKYFNSRSDGRDLTAELSKKGYQMIYDIVDLTTAEPEKVGVFLAEDHLQRFSEGRNDMLSLSVQKTIELLDANQEGFFMMIEGSQIDWGGHDTDTEYIIEEMLDFDRAVGIALDFAKRDRNTLVIVTSDHETGGMAINNGDLSTGMVYAKYTTDDHTGVMVPVFAYGPQSDLFRGIYENTDLFHKMMQAFGFQTK